MQYLTDLAGYLDAKQDAMVAFLERLVRMESPSRVPEAQAPLLDLLAESLEDLDYAVTRLPGRGASGGHLYARPVHREHGGTAQLLLGHVDTVWPIGQLAVMPFEVDGNVIRGPGVFDMKGGLTQLLFALRALRHLGLTPSVMPVVFINSDEEIGSPESAHRIERLARCVRRAFVLEPALGLDGWLKTRRRGNGLYTVRVIGKSAHAGLDPERGASAILELTHVIHKLHALNDPVRGLGVNVGRIEGGVLPNVVAAESRAEVDIRVNTRHDAEAIDRAIRSLEPVNPETRLLIEGEIDRLPMEGTPRNRALWHAAREVGAALGLSLQEGRSGGASDGNLTSPYTATLDGLGPVGDGAHAVHEFVYRDKLAERTALLAGLLMLPPEATDPASRSHTQELIVDSDT